MPSAGTTVALGPRVTLKLAVKPVCGGTTRGLSMTMVPN
jgi:hypothetical protein